MPKQQCEICFSNLEDRNFIWVSCETCENTICSDCFVELKKRADKLSAKCPFCRTLYYPELNIQRKNMLRLQFDKVYSELVDVAHSFFLNVQPTSDRRLEIGYGYWHTAIPTPSILFQSTAIDFAPGVQLVKHNHIWKKHAVFSLSSVSTMIPYMIQTQTLQYHYILRNEADEEIRLVYEDVMENLLDLTHDFLSESYAVIILSCSSFNPTESRLL